MCEFCFGLPPESGHGIYDTDECTIWVYGLFNGLEDIVDELDLIKTIEHEIIHHVINQLEGEDACLLYVQISDEVENEL